MHERNQTGDETTAEIPTDEQLLAAVRRAALHDPRGRPAVPIWTLLEHLEIPRRSARVRGVRERLAALELRGWIERRSARGVPMWGLSAAGLRRLRRVERSRGAPDLPESPQHRAWRRARRLAAQEIERFAAELRRSSADALQMLEDDRDEPIPSDAWFELSAKLARDARLLASARHCLSEWREPDEERADVDTLSAPGDERLDHDRLRDLRVLRAGRRNTLLWREED